MAKRGFAIRRSQYGKARVVQIITRNLYNFRFVVHHQNRFHGVCVKYHIGIVASRFLSRCENIQAQAVAAGAVSLPAASCSCNLRCQA